MFRSTAKTAAVTWTDTETGRQHTTDVTVANGATIESQARGAIAGAKLNGLRDAHRVRIDSVHSKD